MSKRVLIFSLAYFPKHVGGAEVSIKEITDRISDVEFHMVTNRYDSTLPVVEKVGKVLVHRIGITKQNPSMADLRRVPLHLNKPLFQFLAFLKATRLHQKYHYDAVWAVMAHSCGVPAVLFKMFNPEVKYVLNLQEGDPPAQIERTMLPLWPLFSAAFKRADVIQTLSTFLASWARRRGFKGPIEVIPNAVDAKHFSQTYPSLELEEIRKKLDKKEGDIFLVTTSRLVHKNAVDDVIRALPMLASNIFFVILGTGPDEVMLRKLTHDCGVTNRVKFVGYVGHSDMPKYLQVSDIFIRPSRSEGMGVSFPEAMAAGLPVIATQEGGIADFLFDEKRNPDKETTGWAVDVDSPEQIAQAVRNIINDKERTEKVISNARAMVFEKYDWDLIAKEMKERVFFKLF